MEVISCTGGEHISQSIARKLKASHSKLSVKKFPDGELNIKFNKVLKNKEVLLVQSFYGNLNEKIIETLFAAHTAKDLGARKIKLLALYFPYFRQDKRFKKGEAVSIEIMSHLFGIFDKVYTIEPHLHRIKKIKDIMKYGQALEISNILADHIKKWNLKDPVFVGPDDESEQWARDVAKILGKDYTILGKTRSGDRDVNVKLKKEVELKGRDIVIIDDIISTGQTILETIKKLNKFKPKKTYCIAIHGIFSDKKTLNELKKHGKIISTNTIPTKQSKIDVSNISKKLNF